jgi:hypothetical protein
MSEMNSEDKGANEFVNPLCPKLYPPKQKYENGEEAM